MLLRKQFIKQISYPLLLRKQGDRDVLKYLEQFERTQFLPEDELRAWQFRKLRGLLDHAYRKCPFYRDGFDRVGAIPGEIQGLADLALLPILEKHDIQQDRDEMVARDWPPEDLIADQTGGSTGAPISFYSSRDRKRWGAAATIRHNRWAGWDIGDKIAFVWGAPRDRPLSAWRARFRDALIKQQIYLDTANVTEENLIGFHQELKRFRPKVISAYAKAIVLLARYLKARGWTPYQPHSIVTSAEMLEDQERALLEEVFGCRVFDRYGCREVGVVASECEAHSGLHTAAEGLLVEVVRDGKPASPGEAGSILVTDLMNFAMPMIRYRIGDLGTWAVGPCPCGRNLPRLRNIAGRVTEFLVTADGRLVSGVYLATYVVAQRPSLGQVQIHQDQAGSICYRIKPGASFQGDEDLDYLKESTHQIMGPGTEVGWQFVDELRSEPSGKFLFSRSTAAVEYLGAH